MINMINQLKLKYIVAGTVMAVGMVTNANAQTAIDPWTGAIPGDTYRFSSDDSLKNIRKLLNEGKIDEAVTFARANVQSIEQESRSGKTSSLRYDAYNALCISLTAKSSYDEAKEACNTAIKDSPNRWMAYNSRGTLNLKMGNFPEAVSDYNMALNNAPSSSDIRSILEHNVSLAQNKISSN